MDGIGLRFERGNPVELRPIDVGRRAETGKEQESRLLTRIGIFRRLLAEIDAHTLLDSRELAATVIARERLEQLEERLASAGTEDRYRLLDCGPQRRRGRLNIHPLTLRLCVVECACELQ